MKNTLYNIGKWVLTLLVAWGWLYLLSITTVVLVTLSIDMPNAVISSDMMDAAIPTIFAPLTWIGVYDPAGDDWQLMDVIIFSAGVAALVPIIFIVYSLIYWALCLFSPKYQRKPILKPYFICQGLAFTFAYFATPISIAYNYILSLLT